MEVKGSIFSTISLFLNSFPLRKINTHILYIYIYIYCETNLTHPMIYNKYRNI